MLCRQGGEGGGATQAGNHRSPAALCASLALIAGPNVDVGAWYSQVLHVLCQLSVTAASGRGGADRCLGFAIVLVAKEATVGCKEENHGGVTCLSEDFADSAGGCPSEGKLGEQCKKGEGTGEQQK